MINPWIQFVLCAAVIVFAGSRLTRNAAIIADQTGIGTAWAGALLLPLATSLPELVTTLRAVSIDAPDLAIGNLLGSCLYNLALLAIIDLLEGRGPLTARVNQGHIITASLSIISVCIVAIAMLGAFYLPAGWIGFESLLLVVIYIMGSRMIFRYEKQNLAIVVVDEGQEFPTYPVGQAIARFGFAALLIVLAGVLLTDAADQIAISSGLGHTFIGSILLAVSTSLPETVTTITAVRLSLVDMAVANVFGANFMNLFIVFWADLFYANGPLLSAVSSDHVLSAIMVILLSTVVILGLTYRSMRCVARLGFDAILVLSGYLAAVYLLFKTGGN